MGPFDLPRLLLWASQFSVILVALALGLCLIGSYAVMILLRRAVTLRGLRRVGWFLALCLSFGADVWATHFIAMLAFDPGIPIFYNALRTVLSIIVAILAAMPAFAMLIWRWNTRYIWALSGVILGGAIAAMHFVGMSAMELCGSFSYKPSLVVASIIMGCVFAALALRAKIRARTERPVQACLMLAASICGLHFTAMAGLVLSPQKGGQAISFAGANKGSLAIAIAGVSLLLLITLLISATADVKLAEREQEAERLWHLARHDDLTGLLNRRGLYEQLDKLAEKPGAYPMLLSIGLERLKSVNDLFGRELVEQLFCHAAQRLLTLLQEKDVLALPGGDEFVVLRAEALSVEAASIFAREVVALLSAPFVVEGVTMQIGAAVGLVCGEEATKGAETLLNAADIALREAKAAGGGQVCLFTPEMSSRLLRCHQLEQEFQNALHRREVLLFFQPLYDCGGLQLRGFEALARWQHPIRGLIGPDEFIPLAEAGGMINALGDYVLEEACRAALTWPNDLRVAVNLSPIQLKDPALPERVRAALVRSGLAPCRLELELTEGAMLEQTGQVQAGLAALKALGVGLAIDDFGTGYSSLSYLHRFSFERLKIDKSFTREITASQDAQIVTRAIIGLGAALGMAVLAEGVETEAQLNILRKAGCGQVQGFLLGRPMPEADVGPLLARVACTGGRAVPA